VCCKFYCAGVRKSIGLQHTATHCNTLQHTSTNCNTLIKSIRAFVTSSPYSATYNICSVLQCVAVCCSVLQCVALCCSVLQCIAVCCIIYVVCCSVRCARLSESKRAILTSSPYTTTFDIYVAVCCGVLQCGVVCYSVCCNVHCAGVSKSIGARTLQRATTHCNTLPHTATLSKSIGASVTPSPYSAT